MLTFKRMSLEVYRRRNGEGMVALLAQDPTVGCEADAADKAAWDNESRWQHTAGIRYLSFYFTQEEFEGILSGKLSSCNDCGHNVRACGELFTFYDMEFPREARGRMSVPFVNVQIPHYVGKFLARIARVKLAKCEPDGDRVTVEIPWSVRERWMSLYGQGKGKVYVDVLDQDGGKALDFYDACVADGGETFKRCIENLRAIGRNTTYRASETATVKLSKDWDGWYFRILRPGGGCIMNGGVINHGRDGKHEWSTHT